LISRINNIVADCEITRPPTCADELLRDL